MVCLVIFRPFSGACGAQGILYNGINMRSCTRKKHPLNRAKSKSGFTFSAFFWVAILTWNLSLFGPLEGPGFDLEEELRRSHLEATEEAVILPLTNTVAR